MATAPHPPFALAWLRQRDAGARAIEAIEERELAALSPEQALGWTDALLGATPTASIDPRRTTTSGFVEQQRLFARARR
ncbi:MAG: hypothetical protein M3680_04175 [Myxococcota bacterium]|nr:hypothetical protein [Myxococcota bacterium]